MWKHIRFTLAFLLFATTACAPAQPPIPAATAAQPTVTNTLTSPAPTNTPTATLTETPSVAPMNSATEAPTETPTQEVTPTPEDFRGSGILNKDPENPKVVQALKEFRNNLLKFLKDHNFEFPKEKIPQHIYFLSDDPDTNQIEGGLVGILWMSEKDLERIYGPNGVGVSQEELPECRRQAFLPFLTKTEDPDGKWDDPTFWKIEPNKEQAFWEKDKTEGGKTCTFYYIDVTPEGRAAFIKYGAKQPIVAATATPISPK